MTLPCLYKTGRTLPAGEGGCAAGSLPPSHYLKLDSHCKSESKTAPHVIEEVSWYRLVLAPASCILDGIEQLKLIQYPLACDQCWYQTSAPRVATWDQLVD
jgi:hypothetical protein